MNFLEKHKLVGVKKRNDLTVFSLLRLRITQDNIGYCLCMGKYSLGQVCTFWYFNKLAISNRRNEN